MSDFIQQGTDDWHSERIGFVTASKLAAVMASGRGGKPSETRKNYMVELAVARLTGKPIDSSFQTAAMQRGIELEAEARQIYEVKTGSFVALSEFIHHPTIPMTGASPDGIISSEHDGQGILEIKCPLAKTHYEYLTEGSIPNGYILQMQWQMECADLAWADFVSYHPDFPENIQLLIVRQERDEKILGPVRDEVKAFLAELEETVEKLRRIGG